MKVICQLCGEIAFHVEVFPGRAAPPCSNPDSPAFSDSGEGMGIGDHPDTCSKCGAPVSESYIENEASGYLEEESESSYEDSNQYEPEDLLEDDPYWEKDEEDD